MNKFKVGDMVRSKDNDVWTGPMKVVDAPGVSFHRIYSCDHPTRGRGGFTEDDLELVTDAEVTTSIRLVNGTHKFVDDVLTQEQIDRLVEGGIIYHLSTLIYNEKVIKVYGADPRDYKVYDHRTSDDLESLYPQEK